MITYWRALSVFAGTIIGVGIFGLPWVAYKSGFWLLFLYFLILSVVAIVVHLIFGDICLSVKTKHRFPGYVRLYLGRRWGRLAMLSVCFGLLSAQLAYLIVGGGFLTNLLQPYIGGGELIYVFSFFILGSLLIYKGIKSISLTEFLVLIFFFSVLFLFLIKSSPFIKLDNFSSFNPGFLFLPYGVVIFSLWGGSIIPEIKEMIGGNRKLLRKVIISGIILSAVTYLFFTIIIVGVSGSNTSTDAFSGLVSKLGPDIIKVGYIFGIITCFSSFLTLGLTLKKVFSLDMNVSERNSFAFAVFLPFILYLVGLDNFIEIIGLSGAITLGIEGIITILVYKKVLKKKFSRRMHPLYYLFPIFLLGGLVIEIIYFLRR